MASLTKPEKKEKNDVLATNEFGKLRSYLAKLGVRQAEINAAVGTSVNGRSRKELADEIIAWITRS